PASAREMLAELARIAQRVDPVTPPDVGSWARAIIEGPTPATAPRRPTASMSAAPADPLAGKATASFVVREHVDGVTVLEPARVAAPASRRGAVITGLVLGTALFVGAPLAHHWSRPSRANPPPSAVVPHTEPVPLPTATATATATATTTTATTTRLRSAAAPVHAGAAHSAPTAHRGAGAGVGYVNIYAEPWATVTIDGNNAGTTPLARIPLSAGVHRIRLLHPPAARIERLVHIERGQTELVDVDLDSRR
ncbi:MAG: PEGA domain-containing protein, partial [Myxococcales bacterium]|nr:PEGA domain-containing protein [Myxococcales bacterium]